MNRSQGTWPVHKKYNIFFLGGGLTLLCMNYNESVPNMVDFIEYEIFIFIYLFSRP